jgi:hypothetical protein
MYEYNTYEEAEAALEVAIADCLADFGDEVGECDIAYEMVQAICLTASPEVAAELRRCKL